MAAILRKIRLYLIVIIGLFLLSGCFNSQTPEEKIHNVLEQVVSAEKKFEDQQAPLVDLEKKEKKLYDQIINLGKKKQEQINQRADKALENIKKRKEYMEIEQGSMDDSKKEFKKVEPIIEKLKNEKLKDRAKTLLSLMNDRYKVHDDLYNNYLKGLENDQKLYEMFKNNDTTLIEIEEQIKKINKAYGKVIENNQAFNDLTKEYNEKKMAFYKEANLDISKK